MVVKDEYWRGFDNHQFGQRKVPNLSLKWDFLGTPIDKEAANRSTTVYLTDRRIDMVPELLSSNLCSLRGEVERFAFSCLWEITEGGEILSTKFHKSIIKSKSAMTYEQAQNKIDDINDTSPIAKSLRNLVNKKN